ncbi:DNA-protecting protein DprA [Candidatus Peregrinibacteria bacterium]|nr:DNA-protecting protein DprA [Candidatus Peregrinibacteria bacterium]
MSNAAYIHAFWLVPEMSYQKLNRIGKYFDNDFKLAWEKGKSTDFEKLKIAVEAIEERRKKIDINKSMEVLWQNDIQLIDRDSPEYPEEFKHIYDAPWLIYRKGAALNKLQPRISVVGMRKSTVSGEKLAFNLGRIMAQNDVTVVSGLAFGIDAAVHSGVVKENGKTIGVLASGIGKITPSSHHSLAEQILANGGSIISEYPLSADAWKFQFVERNRLIAALGQMTVVVEAAKKSGALITAKHATEMNKTVAAFPGDVGKIQSEGCNILLKQGALILTSADDILDELKIKKSNEGPQMAYLNQVDRAVYNLIKEGFGNIEALLGEMPISLADLLASLSSLEIAGMIRRGNNLDWLLA